MNSPPAQTQAVSAERIVTVDGIELCCQSFGDPSDPALVLLAGTSCSMDWWPPTFCSLLAERGFFVIRYDQRDTGRSIHDLPGQPSYSLPDLAADASRLLTEYGISTAHWVGFSSGGWVAQIAAVHDPSRVASLALISSRPTGHGPADDDLPEVTDSLLAAWDSASEPDWRDRGAVLDYLVAGELALAAEPFDEPAVRLMCARALERAADIRASVTNHPIAAQGPRWREQLAKVTVPTVVLHGDVDPLFPAGNARALTAEIPGARLKLLPGVGHELAPSRWPEYVDAIAGNASAADDQRRPSRWSV